MTRKPVDYTEQLDSPFSIISIKEVFESHSVEIMETQMVFKAKRIEDERDE